MLEKIMGNFGTDSVKFGEKVGGNGVTDSGKF